MPSRSAPKTVVVIGAGLTGLTAGYRLNRLGYRVRVLERSERPGGVIRSTREEGFLVEGGPNVLSVDEPALLEFLREIGLGSEVVVASPDAQRRFIVRRGRPVPVPTSLSSFLRTPLLSAVGKLRLLAEPFAARAEPGLEDSMAEFTRRRLGVEALDYMVNPLMAGVYAGDPERLSVRHAFPSLHRLELQYGSLTSGGLATALRRGPFKKRFKARSISFRTGLQAIIDALSTELGNALSNGVTIDALEPGPPFRVRFRSALLGAEMLAADAIVLAVPGHEAAKLPFSSISAERFSVLREVEYPAVASVALGFPRAAVQHPVDGFGVLVPAREGLHILGTLFTSSLFVGRAPDGSVLLTTYVGGTRQPELTALPDHALCRIVQDDLRQLLGVEGEPTFRRVARHPHAIAQYNLGYQRFHTAMEGAEVELPGLFMGGSLRNGPSLGACIRAGIDLAARVANADRGGR